MLKCIAHTQQRCKIIKLQDHTRSGITMRDTVCQYNTVPFNH